ncbi:MAG: DnaJ domain-containing protein [Bacteroidetes bacterium]|nr:DnaJ domain-containing protein [Bacteroidota bacterium]
MPDYYQILGVNSTATTSDVKKAYRKLAMQYHPDRNPANTEAYSRFLLIQTAYETLSDPELRAMYDSNLLHGYFYDPLLPVTYYFDISTDKNIMRADEELIVTFEYTGEGRVFRRPDFKGFKIASKPYVNHDFIFKDGIEQRRTRLSYVLAPYAKGIVHIGKASIKIFNKAYETGSVSVMVEETPCFFTRTAKADGPPVCVPLLFETVAHGTLYSSTIYNRHDIYIPRSKAAQQFHRLGLALKLLIGLSVLIIGLKASFGFWFSLSAGICIGGLNCNLLYLLAGIKSRFYASHYYPMVRSYCEGGYYPGKNYVNSYFYNRAIYYFVTLIL